MGVRGEPVVLGCLALELTDSPFLVGVAMGARALPLFFVGVPAGVLADRFPRHRLLMATSAGQALTAGALGVLTLVGGGSPAGPPRGPGPAPRGAAGPPPAAPPASLPASAPARPAGAPDRDSLWQGVM